MPVFTIPIHEHNDCHNPPGLDGGQFCSGDVTGKSTYLKREIARIRKAGPKVDVRTPSRPGFSHQQAGRIELGWKDEDTRADRLSVLRHEAGHAFGPEITDKAQRSRRWKANSRRMKRLDIANERRRWSYASEFEAWKHALEVPPHRVRIATMRDALSSYGQSYGRSPALVQRDVLALQRYGRRLRLRRKRAA